MERHLQEKFATDPHRPHYHFLPPAHWMNDPNGLMHLKGKYHLFYQHNPAGAFHANMHWGHAQSTDLVHWKHLPIALAPTPGGPDKDGVYSGCGVINNGIPTLVYTGVRPQVQCLATGSEDMITWAKYDKNPVIGAPPEGLEVTGFRDPCVWQESDRWYMLVGSGIKDLGGTALLYASGNLTDWEYLHPIYVGDKTVTGEMWECPTFFPLGDKHALLVSTVGTVLYFVGTWSELRFSPESQGRVDFGDSFYAAQAFPDEQGRRIVFGWLRENRGVGLQKEAGWSGVMSLPRIPFVREEGGLGMGPAPEITLLRGKHERITGLDLAPQSPKVIPQARGDRVEIVAVVQPGDAAQCGLALHCSPHDEERTVLSYDRQERRIRIDRRRSSLSANVALDVHEAPVGLSEGEAVTFHIFLDGSVIEVFADGGVCLTSRVYPTRADSVGVKAFAVGGRARIKSLDVWQMKAIW